MTNDLTITTAPHGSVTVVAITGSVDTLTADEVLGSLRAALEAEQTQLVVDFSGVDYTSSAGLRAILAATKESRQTGGDLRLAAVSSRVLKVLELSGFTSILQVHPDVAAAVASYHA